MYARLWELERRGRELLGENIVGRMLHWKRKNEENKTIRSTEIALLGENNYCGEMMRVSKN